MSFPQDQVDELKALFGDVLQAMEGGFTFLLVEDVGLPPGCTPTRSDLLLCPAPKDGYPSRLYFRQHIGSKQQRNWNGNLRLLEHNWCAFSWNTGAVPLRLAQMIGAHLEGLR